MNFMILAPNMRRVILTYQKAPVVIKKKNKKKKKINPYSMVVKKGWTEMYDWGFSDHNYSVIKEN